MLGTWDIGYRTTALISRSCLFFCFKRWGRNVAKSSPKLTILLRMTLNSWSSGKTGMSHHTQFIQYWGLNPEPWASEACTLPIEVYSWTCGWREEHSVNMCEHLSVHTWSCLLRIFHYTFSSNILLRKIIDYLENMKKYSKATNLLLRFYYKHFFILPSSIVLSPSCFSIYKVKPLVYFALILGNTSQFPRPISLSF